MLLSTLAGNGGINDTLFLSFFFLHPFFFSTLTYKDLPEDRIANFKCSDKFTEIIVKLQL